MTKTTKHENERLSKLTLSASLHQIHNFNYTPNMNNNDNHNAANNPSTTSTTSQHATNHNKSIILRKSKYKKEAKLDTVHVVVGNEACDLDSAVSCLLMFHIVSKMSDEINGRDNSHTVYIPLFNTTRDMLDTKSEVIWFLKKTLSIDNSFLTCKDDINWNELKKNGINILVTLVDHNYNEEFSKIGRIVEIIDHHQLQNPQWFLENCSSLRTTIDTAVGSCTTLVAEKLFYIYAEHHVSDEILLLIYGTVLLDTCCLSERAKRYTRRDLYLLRKLDCLLGSKKPVRDDLYKSLVDVKSSNRELDFERLMKRDLKLCKTPALPEANCCLSVGIASLFGMSAQDALGLSVNVDWDLFFSQNNYNAFIIMGLVADPKQPDSISRDLVLISANDKLFDDLCNSLESQSSNLDLVEIRANVNDPEHCYSLSASTSITTTTTTTQHHGSFFSSAGVAARSNKAVVKFDPLESMSLCHYNAKIWNQKNVSSSRKIIAPIVMKVLHERAIPSLDTSNVAMSDEQTFL